jgi:hypothetical protein
MQTIQIQLPIGVLADRVLDEIEELELRRKGEEFLEELEREEEARRASVASYSI